MRPRFLYTIGNFQRVERKRSLHRKFDLISNHFTLNRGKPCANIYSQPTINAFVVFCFITLKMKLIKISVIRVVYTL